jgi:hypothetical protein
MAWITRVLAESPLDRILDIDIILAARSRHRRNGIVAEFFHGEG